MAYRFSELPLEVQLRMFTEQNFQGNSFSARPFLTSVSSSKQHGGFDWDATEDGDAFWNDVLIDGNLKLFFDTYPFLPNYPMLLYVKNTRMSEYVLKEIITEKNGLYLSIEEQGPSKIPYAKYWSFAKKLI